MFRDISFHKFYTKVLRSLMYRGSIIIKWQRTSITRENWYECMQEKWHNMDIAPINVICD